MRTHISARPLCLPVPDPARSLPPVSPSARGTLLATSGVGLQETNSFHSPLVGKGLYFPPHSSRLDSDSTLDGRAVFPSGPVTLPPGPVVSDVKPTVT